LDVGDEPEKYRRRASTHVNYRPALTHLRECARSIHSVYVTDLSRLSRSYDLTSDLLTYFSDAEHPIKLRGTVDNLDDLNDQHGAGKFAAVMYGLIASEKLKEVLSGCMRGHITLMEAGYPYGKLPSWCAVDENTGKAILHPERSKAIKRLVEIYLEGKTDGSDASYFYVAKRLAEEGYKAPNAEGGSFWNTRTVKDWLKSPALLGYQAFYGLLFPTLPPVIDEDTATRIKERMEGAAAGKRTYGIINPDGYLMQGLLVCSCGNRLIRHPGKTSPRYICRPQAGELRRASRKSDTTRHYTTPVQQMDDWINDFMERYHGEVFAHIDGVDSARRLDDRLRHWQAEAEKRRAACLEAEKEMRPQAETSAAAVADPQDADFEQWVERAIRKLTRQYREQWEAAEEEIKHTKRELAEHLPTGNLRDQAANWSTLNNLQKNKILRSIFREFRVVGDVPNEVMVPVLRTEGNTTLPPIKLITTQRGTGATAQYHRSMPDVAAWVRTWGNTTHADGSTSYRVPPMPRADLERIAPKLAHEMAEDLAADGRHEEMLADPTTAAAHVAELERAAASTGPLKVRRRSKQ